MWAVTTNCEKPTVREMDGSHGIMFHHFHLDGMPAGEIRQGSIEANRLETILRSLKEKTVLNDARDWLDKVIHHRLGSRDTCLTFDDNSRSQYEVARPVLDALGIRAFFFVYTAMYEGELPRLDIYASFRDKYFDDFDHFFIQFCLHTERILGITLEIMEDHFPETHLAEFSFYSREERIFRYVRDHMLKPYEYETVMDYMIDKVTSPELLAREIWMSPGEIIRLHDEGHVIGLHSAHHPTHLAGMGDDIQEQEYITNKRKIEDLVGTPVKSVSYPSGSYNAYTLGLMRRFGITAGFRADMEKGSLDPLLELPRLDAAYLGVKGG
jgi:peptidoglycan/xylan/chitin deacetylase (PgdA/CDA1 family)